MASVLGIEDGFCFQELEHPNQQRKELNQLVDYSDNLASASSAFACFGSLPVQIMQSLSSELEKQRLEMDWFLQMENKRLRRSILEEETRQKALLMRKYESRIKILMLQKDEELAFARNKTRELQDFLTRAEMEAKAWEKKATEKEAIVSDLNNRLNQVKMKDDDAVSFCDSSSSSSSGRKVKKRL
ncbi:hypothetical protein DH2020_007455 [Rehmannia glutinosa]|uniref:Uncharacterized protein n=1 Tax=Rehmannia glutinosa TaxID=99300 RepID=A0ABR0TYP2_REHGL